jgi:hypothetical protein
VKYQAQVAEWATFFLTDPSKIEEWERNVLSPSPLRGEGKGKGEHKQPLLIGIDDYDILTTELWGGRIEDICKKLERRIFARQKDKQAVILIWSSGLPPAPNTPPFSARGGSAFDGEKPPPFEKGGPWGGSETSTSLDPSSESVEIELSNFTLEDIRDYLAAITGVASPPQALVEQVHINTGGNPFVVTEVIKTLVGSGMLVDSQGRWKSTTFEDIKIDLAKLQVPASVEDRLLRDIEGVPEEARSLAEMMAVYGRPMSLFEIESVFSSVPSPLPARQLDNGGMGEGKGGGASPSRGTALMLVRRGIVRINTIDGTYYFTRPLLAKAIYSRMSEADRMHWHDKISMSLRAPQSGAWQSREPSSPPLTGPGGISNPPPFEKGGTGGILALHHQPDQDGQTGP